MTDLPSQESENRIAIGGIKFSEELVQIGVACRKTTNDWSFEDVLQLLAENIINIPFLCHSSITSAPESVFCVDCNDFDTVQNLLNASPFDKDSFQLKRAVGTLTLFPHRYSFHFLGLIISVLSRFSYPIYSLSTSISAVAINTDFFSLDSIAEKLQTVIDLPENHAPFRQEFCLKQIQQ